MRNSPKRWVFAVWSVLICSFAMLHALNLRADFSDHSSWLTDDCSRHCRPLLPS